MSCTYTYNGRQYSKQGLIRAFQNMKDIIPLVSDNAINFLKRNLNMSEDEIVFVAGLIDNNSIGRFQGDGKILLSSLADDSVAYHEAFHRVFRGYLKRREQKDLVAEFKKRNKWKSLIEGYRADYPFASDEELIEEFLADEFSDYIINNGNIKIEQPIRSIFDRIIDFLRKIVGLKSTQRKQVYDKIKDGAFSSYTLQKTNFAPADKVIINGKEYSSDIKNEFVQGVTRLVVQQLLDDQSIYDFIKHSSDADISTIYLNAFSIVTDVIRESDPNLADDILADAFFEDASPNPNSYINNQFKQYIESLIGKFDFNIVEQGEEDTQNEEGDVSQENGRKQDDVAWKPSFEIDPKTSMSKAIKMLLASFEDTTKPNSLGIATQVRWSQAFNKIARHMAGVPSKDAIKHLSTLNESWANELVERLGGLEPDGATMNDDTLRLRNDFIKSFAKTEHTYAIAKVGEKGITWFDANQETAKKRIIKNWKNNLVAAIKNDGSFERWFEILSGDLADRYITDEDLGYRMGVTVDDELKNQVLYTINNESYFYMTAMFSIGKYIKAAVEKNKFNNDNLPDYNKIFDKNNFDVEGLIEHIAEAQLEFEDAVDLMLFSRDKKLYGISLNTHTTTTINTLNYIAERINRDDTLENKLKVVEEYLPSILNYQTVDRNDEGGYTIKSKWLNHILDGNKITMTIMDGLNTDSGDTAATADVNESDLHAMTLNMSLNGVNISIKHSDRSTFFGYKLNNASIFDYQQQNTPHEEAVIDYLTKVLQDALGTEVKRSNIVDAPIFQYFTKNYRTSQLFVGLGNIQNLNPYSAEIEKLVSDTIKEELQKYKNDLIKHGIFDDNIGIDEGLLKYHNGNINLMVASAFANQMLTHLEEVKIFLGDFTFFKNADDFYKRMSTTSGTGENLTTDTVTNARIAHLNSEKFTIVNPRTGETEEIVYDKDPNGVMNGLTLKEKDDYNSLMHSVKDKVSPIDGQNISELQYTFEWNLMKDEIEMVGEINDEAKSRMKQLSAAYANAYDGINENDGQSWMNMFFFREYQIRLGNWSTAMDNLFNAELQILNARTTEDLKNISIEIDGETKNVFDNSLWADDVFESVHTLKSQYAGPVQSYLDYKKALTEQIDHSQKVSAYGIYKTSYHALWPSTVLGTNLQQMHHFMLKNKIDVLHMNSANKSGGIDIQEVFKRQNQDELSVDQKLVASDGFNFYDPTGHFNDTIFNGELGSQLLEQSTSVANLNYLKDQVRVGNKEKEEIKGSTQSLKILISNLIPNGKPRFPGADTLAKRYTDVIAALVERNINSLKEEVGYDGNAITKIDTLVKLIRTAAKDRQSPVNIIQAIDAFLYDPFIESLPNKTKLENIFYSIINNNVVSFNRPGNTYPQVASTGFEPLGTRNVTEGKGKLIINTNDDLVKFYSAEIDEEGNIIKVNPAEIIMPFPSAWIPSLLQKAGTTNIADAIDWVNKKIENGQLDSEVTFKALRIPNQQLSSNDIVKVKKFHLPSNKNYVIVPSELVAKTGGDFDIDKESIYWTNSKSLFRNKDIEAKEDLTKHTDEELQNILLQLEKKILLHPRNAHMLLMPVIDDLLKKEAFSNIVVNLKGEQRDNTTFLQSLTPTKNVEKSIDFVKSKFGVGVVALDITGHAVFMNDDVNLNEQFFDKDGDPISTRLKFEGLQDVYTLTSMVDSTGRIISDIQSQVMNSQVDAGKDPYAVKLGINNQTLNTVLYLNRRTVDIQSALKFVNQPLIQEYLLEQRKNESLINKERGDELSKPELIEKILRKYSLENTKPKNAFVISKDKLDKGLNKKNSIGEDQAQMFHYFLHVIDEVSSFNDLKNSLTVDTKGKKDKASVEAFRSLQAKVNTTQIVSTENIAKLRNTGILAPFHDAQDLYEQFYDPFYALDSSDFGQNLKNFKQMMEDRQRGNYKKEKVRTAIENDFFIFLIQNYSPDFSLNDFNDLFGLTEGTRSLPEEIREMQKTSDNHVIKAMFPLISISKESTSNRMHDVLRLFERELSAIDVNDFIDSMKDLKDENEDLYKRIIRMSLYQAGFLNSPFSLNKIFPTLNESTYEGDNLKEFTNEYMRDVQIETLRMIPFLSGNTDRLFSQFQQLFFMNNPEFLAKKWYARSPVKFYYPYSRAEKKNVLMYKESKDTAALKFDTLGSSYFKRYFVSLLDAGAKPIQQVEPTTTSDRDQFFPSQVQFDGADAITINVKSSNIDKDFNPNIIAEPTVTNNGEEIKFVIRDNSRWIGRVYANLDDTNLDVYSTDINGEPNSGTSAYLQIAQYAYDNGLTFRSDTDERMNDASRALWNRFVKVGLATLSGGRYTFNQQKKYETDPNDLLTPLISEFGEQIITEFGFDTANDIVNDEVYYDYMMKKLKAFNPNLKFQYYQSKAGYTYSAMHMSNDFILPLEGSQYFNSNGVASQFENKIRLNKDARKKTVIHEVVHLTLEQEMDKHGEFYNKMVDLYDYADKYDFEHGDPNKPSLYGFSNVHEFLAEALANPEFMKRLNEIPYKKENVLSEMLNLISSFLSKIFGLELNTGSVLAEVVSLSERIIQDKNAQVEAELNKISDNHNMQDIGMFFPEKKYFNDAQRSALTNILDRLPSDVNLSCSI